MSVDAAIAQTESPELIVTSRFPDVDYPNDLDQIVKEHSGIVDHRFYTANNLECGIIRDDQGNEYFALRYSLVPESRDLFRTNDFRRSLDVNFAPGLHLSFNTNPPNRKGDRPFVIDAVADLEKSIKGVGIIARSFGGFKYIHDPAKGIEIEISPENGAKNITLGDCVEYRLTPGNISADMVRPHSPKEEGYFVGMSKDGKFGFIGKPNGSKYSVFLDQILNYSPENLYQGRPLRFDFVKTRNGKRTANIIIQPHATPTAGIMFDQEGLVKNIRYSDERDKNKLTGFGFISAEVDDIYFNPTNCRSRGRLDEGDRVRYDVVMLREKKRFGPQAVNIRLIVPAISYDQRPALSTDDRVDN